MLIDRNDLYGQIWTTPASQLCKRFGFSDVWLAKLCKKHGIPRPPRGYWAKKRNGKTTRRIPLPPVSNGTESRIEIRDTPPPDKKTTSPAAEKRVNAAKATSPAIVVTRRLNAPHPLVERTRNRLGSAKPDYQWGLLWPGGDGCLNVAIGPKSVDRAMRIMDALIKALEARGHRVRVDGRGTLVDVNGESMSFRLTERAVRKLREESGPNHRPASLYLQYEFSPSGDLRLEIEGGYRANPIRIWKDGKRKRIEDQLDDFIVGLGEVSEQMKARREHARLAEIEEERKRKIREEAEHLRREEEERARWVEATLDSWKRWRSLGRMIRDARNRASRLGRRITPESRMGRWLETAERRLARLDPLAPMVDELPDSTPLVSRFDEERGESSVD